MIYRTPMYSCCPCAVSHVLCSLQAGHTVSSIQTLPPKVGFSKEVFSKIFPGCADAVARLDVKTTGTNRYIQAFSESRRKAFPKDVLPTNISNHMPFHRAYHSIDISIIITEHRATIRHLSSQRKLGRSSTYLHFSLLNKSTVSAAPPLLKRVISERSLDKQDGPGVSTCKHSRPTALACVPNGARSNVRFGPAPSQGGPNVE